MNERPVVGSQDKTVLKKGMTFVVHPNIYPAFTFPSAKTEPGKSGGAMVGDTVCVTDTGAKPLCKFGWAVDELAII